MGGAGSYTLAGVEGQGPAGLSPRKQALLMMLWVAQLARSCHASREEILYIANLLQYTHVSADCSLKTSGLLSSAFTLTEKQIQTKFERKKQKPILFVSPFYMRLGS